MNAAFKVERFFVDGDRTDLSEISSMLRKGRFLLAEEDGRLLGSVYVEIRGERGYFGLLAIDPARQRAGLGRRLVAEAEAEALATGCRAMDIQVVNLRLELPPFYRRLGYVEIGTAPFPEHAPATQPCHFIRMAKGLCE